MPFATFAFSLAIATTTAPDATAGPTLPVGADLTLEAPAAAPGVALGASRMMLAESATLAGGFDPGAVEPGMLSAGAASLALQDDETAPVMGEQLPAPKPYGTAGMKYWHLQAGWASDFATTDNTFIRLGIGWGYFVADGLSLDLGLSSLLVSQDGDDAVGLNLDMVLRWHFVRERTWSLYAEAGFGVMGSNDKIPSLGSSFNFTPQGGGGYTVELTEGTRLMLGVRWFHISNARTFENNPGRDSVYAYAALSFSY